MDGGDGDHMGKDLTQKVMYLVIGIIIGMLLLYIYNTMMAPSTEMKKEGLSDGDLFLRNRLLNLNLQADPMRSGSIMRREGMVVDPLLVSAALK